MSLGGTVEPTELRPATALERVGLPLWAQSALEQIIVNAFPVVKLEHDVTFYWRPIKRAAASRNCTTVALRRHK